MHDHQLFLRTLSEFTRSLLTPYDVHVMLAELAGQVTHVLGLVGSGVSLAEGDRLIFDVGVGDQAEALEELQEETQLGPCVAAFHSGRIVRISDLGAEVDRWPAFCRLAELRDIRAVASIPMRLGDQRVGALNLYAREVRAWDEDDMTAAVVLADMATAYLINASKHQQQVQLAEQLQRALDGRVLVEQAKGMLAARHDTTPDVAFEHLRRYARGRGASVREVAAAVVQLGLDIAPDDR